MSAAVFPRRAPGLRFEYGNEVALRTEAEHAADGGKRIIRSQEQFLCLVDANIPDEILNTGIGFFLKNPRKMRGGNMRVLCQLSDRDFFVKMKGYIVHGFLHGQTINVLLFAQGGHTPCEV